MQGSIEISNLFWSRAGARAAALLALLGICFALAETAEAGRINQPNIVLVLTDDQTYESLDEMAYVDGRNDWIRFDNGILNNPLCCPTRAALLSGQYSHHNNVETNFDGENFRDGSSLGTWFDRAGYQTGFFGKYLNRYPWGRDGYVPPGWDRWFAHGPRVHYYEYPTINEKGRTRFQGTSERAYSTDLMTRQALRFIRDRRKRKPFMAFLSYYGPHWQAPRRYSAIGAQPAKRHLDLYPDRELIFPPSFKEEDVSDKPAWIQAIDNADLDLDYNELKLNEYRALQSIDEGVKKLFRTLRNQKIGRKTIVIYMSDNGFAYGDHRTNRKPCVYEVCLQTPLLIRYPGQPGRTESAVVSSVDIPVTMAKLARVTPTNAIDGLNIGPIIRDRKELVRGVALFRGVKHKPGQSPTFWGVRGKRFKYSELDSGEKELYDLYRDPHELDNVAGTPEYAEIEADLLERLERLRADYPHQP